MLNKKKFKKPLDNPFWMSYNIDITNKTQARKDFSMIQNMNYITTPLKGLSAMSDKLGMMLEALR